MPTTQKKKFNQLHIGM